MDKDKFFIIKDNEECPCGSGEKYLKCCKYRKDDPSFNLDKYMFNESRLNYEVISMLNESKFKTCFHPKKEECSNDIKNAHSLQNNGVLSLLAENGHVMHINNRISMEGVELEVAPVGKNKATTFTGFCGYHDTEIFKPIETVEYSPLSEEQNFLYAYRIYAYEYYKKLVAIITFQNSVKKKPSILKNEFFAGFYHNYMLSKNDLKTYETIFNTSLLKKDYSVIKTHTIKFDFRLPFATCFAFSPEYDLEGNPLGVKHMMEANPTRLPLNFVTVLPMNEKSYIIYSWLEEDGEYFRKFINQLKSLTLIEIKRYFNNLLPEYTENLVFNPRYWRRLSEHQKESLLKKLKAEFNDFENIDFDGENKQYLGKRAEYNLFRDLT